MRLPAMVSTGRAGRQERGPYALVGCPENPFRLIQPFGSGVEDDRVECPIRQGAAPAWSSYRSSRYRRVPDPSRTAASGAKRPRECQRISIAARGAVKAQSTNAETPKAMARNSTILPRNTATPKGMTDIRVAGTARVTGYSGGIARQAERKQWVFPTGGHQGVPAAGPTRP
jgi:hypothetical protein